MPNQADYSQQIRDALAVSDPQMSTALGTPQRKLIEAVASTLSLASTEQTTTYFTGYIDSYSGTDLDAYVEQFGFSRQQAGAASGTVTVRRENASTALTINYGTTFYKPSTSNARSVRFSTTVGMVMPVGVVSCEIPVVCTVAGSVGNVAAHTVTYSDAIVDYTVIDNPNPMTGGFDEETDEALRQRFKNTLFRNMAGTKDQYLGLAMAYSFTTRAKLVGETSSYQEVIEVAEEEVDGETILTAHLDCPGFVRLINDGTDDQVFHRDFSMWARRLSDGSYLRQGIDFSILDSSVPSVQFTDASATLDVGEMVGPFDSEGYDWLTNGNVSNVSLYPYKEGEQPSVQLINSVLGSEVWRVDDAVEGKLHMNRWACHIGTIPDFDTSGVYNMGRFSVTVTGPPETDFPGDVIIWALSVGSSYAAFMTDLTGANLVGNMSGSANSWAYDSFRIVVIGAVTTADATLPPDLSYDDNPLYRVSYDYRLVNKGDFLSLSMDYVSDAWREGTNNVDLYVDGDNLVSVEDVTIFDSTREVTSGMSQGGEFMRDNGNYPITGNFILPLSYQPVRSLEDSIAVGAGITLTEGVDYWLVREHRRSDTPKQNRGSYRANDFVELNQNSDKVSAITDNTPLHVGYVYNAVPGAIQELVDAQTPVCTDILVHEAVRRRFRVNLTVMYTTYQESDMTERISQAVIDWANSREFGVTVQFSDIETVVANLGGVDNVRVTTENDNADQYGIEEFQPDGTTVKSVFVNDFRLEQDEMLIVDEVVVNAKTQQGW